MTEPGNLVPKTVMENPALPSIQVNGNKLHAQAFGPAEGTLVVCIHGGPGSSFRYMLNSKSLADKGYRVVFYDQVGSGLSQRRPAEWYENQGGDAIERIFYDELDGVINHYKTKPDQKVVLLTQSWGSILATGYAGRYPDKVAGLILAEPGGLQWDDIVEYVSDSQSFGLWSEALNDAAYLDQFITGKQDEHEILDFKLQVLASGNNLVGDVKSELGTNGMYYKSDRIGAVIGSAAFRLGQKDKPDFSQGISRYQRKVLFFYSSNNRAYPDGWAQKISAVYPNKKVIKVQGVGHSGMFDQIGAWTNVTEPAVLDYLKSL